MDTPITHATLLAHEALQKRITDRVSAVAQDYYEIVNGSRLHGESGVRLTNWERDDDEIVAAFRWNYGGEHAETIRFAVAYLENDDWREPLRRHYKKRH